MLRKAFFRPGTTWILLIILTSSMAVSSNVRAQTNIILEGIEATQATRLYPNLSANQQVPLIRNKPTYVRTYMRVLSGDAVSNLTGSLKVTDYLGRTRFLYPLNDPISVDKVGSERIQWEAFEFEPQFEDSGNPVEPVVFSQTQTKNGSDFVRTRHREIDSRGFQSIMEKKEALKEKSDGHASEEIGWVAVEPGSSTSDGNPIEAGHDWTKFEVDENVMVMPRFRGGLSENDLENDQFIRLIPENSNVSLSNNLTVNYTSAGTYNSPGSAGTSSIFGGQNVNSYLLHFDPRGTSNVVSRQARISFPNPILGVIVNKAELFSSDSTVATLNRNDTGSSSDWALEDRDSITLENDGYTVTLSAEARSGADQVRVITSSSPIAENLEFNTSFSNTPKLQASVATHRGGDPVALRRTALSSTGGNVVPDEEQSEDGERNHINERVHYLAIEGGGVLQGYEFYQGASPDDVTELTETEYNEVANSGMVASDGTVTDASSIDYFKVGDDASDDGRHALIEFPLDDIADGVTESRIKKADLRLSISSATGSPYQDLGQLSVVHVEYGNTIDASDYRTNRLTFRPGKADIPFGTTFGTELLDVTRAIKDAWSRRNTQGKKVQFVVYLTDRESDNDSSADFVSIDTGNPQGRLRPTLEVTYEEKLFSKKVIGEVGTVSNLTHRQKDISLQHTYQDPVVMAQTPSRNGNDAVTARISQVQSDQFSIELQEANASNGTHVQESVDYLVLEAGSWQLQDGTRIEAGSRTSDLTAGEKGRQANGTLNFLIPSSQAVGTLTLEPEVSGPNVNQTSNRSRTVSFNRTDPVDVLFYDVRYTAEANEMTPSSGAMKALAAPSTFAGITFPSRFNYKKAGTIEVSDSLADGLGPVNKKLAKVKKTSSPPPNFTSNTQYYGIIPSGATTKGSLGLSSRGVVSGIEGLSDTFVHEVGHDLGRPHATSYGFPKGMDASYPIYTNFHDEPRRGGSIGQVGFSRGETGRGRIWDPETTSDFMGYARRWVSPYTYLKLYQEVKFPSTTSAGIPHTGAATQQQITLPSSRSTSQVAGDDTTAYVVSGVINTETMQGKIESVYLVDSATPEAGSEAPSEYMLKLLAESGEVLDTKAIALQEPTEGDPTSEIPWIELLSGVSEAHRIVVTHPDLESPVAVRVASEASPQVEWTGQPTPGSTVDESMTVEWNASDADGGEVTYILQYSRDGGSSWSSLAVDLKRSRFKLYPEDVAGTKEGKLRVVASDGFRATSAVTEGVFTVEGHSPDASITSPPSESVSLQHGDPLSLQGSGTDREDGMLGNSQLSWNLDGKPIGTGEQVHPTSMLPGEHQIVFAATDSSGQTDRDSLTVTVTARDEGMSDIVVHRFEYTGDSVVNPGDRIGANIKTIISNEGGENTDADVGVGYYLSSDAEITTEDRLITGGREGISSLDPGGSQNVQLAEAASIPGGIEPGEYFLGVLADESDTVDEGNELNNFSTVRIRIKSEDQSVQEGVESSGVWVAVLAKGGAFLSGISTVEDISGAAGSTLGGQQSVFTWGGSMALGSRNGPLNARLTGLRTTSSLVSATEGIDNDVGSVPEKLLLLTGDLVLRPIPRLLIQPYAIGGVGGRRLSVIEGDGDGVASWNATAQVGIGADLRLGGVTLGAEVVDYMSSPSGGLQHDAFVFLVLGVPIN